MKKSLADRFRRERENRGLSYANLAWLMGYRGKGIVGGANKICQFEITGKIHPDILSKLASVLEIDSEVVERLKEEDEESAFKAWAEWARQPITPHIVVRLIPGVYQRRPLAEGISSREAFEIATEVAQTMHCKACLVLSRHVSYWFDEQGRITGISQAIPGFPNTPTMSVNGQLSRRFCLGAGDRMLAIEERLWPLSSHG